jgi:hypothetical protein
MAMYATPSELASSLQKDLDTASATQALERASERFSRRARKRWTATAGTWKTTATYATRLAIPYRNITAITAIKVNGVAVPVDYTLRNGTVYRDLGFGDPYAWPADEVLFEFTYGLTTAPDDVKDAVLSMAGEIYEHPDGSAVSETIDDYSIKYDGRALQLSGRDWREVADHYRGILVA